MTRHNDFKHPLIHIIVVRPIKITVYFFMVFNYIVFENIYRSLEVILVSKINIYYELDNHICHKLDNQQDSGAVFMHVFCMFLDLHENYYSPESFNITSLRSEHKVSKWFHWRRQLSSNHL